MSFVNPEAKLSVRLACERNHAAAEAYRQKKADAAKRFYPPPPSATKLTPAQLTSFYERNDLLASPTKQLTKQLTKHERTGAATGAARSAAGAIGGASTPLRRWLAAEAAAARAHPLLAPPPLSPSELDALTNRLLARRHDAYAWRRLGRPPRPAAVSSEAVSEAALEDDARGSASAEGAEGAEGARPTPPATRRRTPPTAWRAKPPTSRRAAASEELEGSFSFGMFAEVA